MRITGEVPDGSAVSWRSADRPPLIKAKIPGTIRHCARTIAMTPGLTLSRISFTFGFGRWKLDCGLWSGVLLRLNMFESTA
jgi:hypothetical protein